MRKDGTINFGGKIFNSPSIAGARAIGRQALNGWKAWKFKNNDGEWVYLDELRRGRRPGRKAKATAPKKAGRFASDNVIVCPAKEDGFRETFLGENCWYAIRISPKRIMHVKYIAIYRTRPVSAITHYARVASIKPYKNTGKYIVHLATKPRKIGPIPLKKGSAPQGPAFTTWEKLKKVRSIGEVLQP